jgi:hypothetical protein
MVAVETLYLTALLSAFIGLIGLFALTRSDIKRSAKLKNFLGAIVVVTAIVSVGSLFLYSQSPHNDARSVYGSTAARIAGR